MFSTKMSLFSGLLQVFVVLVGFTGQNAGVEEGVIREARCRARCLGELASLTSEIHDPSAVSLSSCHGNNTCSKCLQPCDFKFGKLEDCTSGCENHPSCLQTCSFLTDIVTNKPGTCPPADSAVGFAAVCVEACTTDASCSAADEKCCDNGCGHTCQKALGESIWLPARPYIKRVHEMTRSNQVVITWKPSAVQRLYVPVVHILQLRQNPGQGDKQGLWTEWETVHMTTQYSASIEKPIPGYLYEFRVASASSNGSVGFSPSSKAFRLSRVPQLPSQPTNLTEGRTTVHDGKIDVDIHWLPPKTSDLPILRYRVFWSERLSAVSPVFVSLREHRHSVSGNQNRYRIKNLKPDTTYFIEVQAICRYGRKKMRSRRSSFYITTYVMPTTQSARPTVFDIAFLDLPTPPPVVNLTVPQVFYSKDMLRAKVTWQVPTDGTAVHKYTIHWVALVCQDEPQTEAIRKGATTHDTMFTIYGLENSCNYEVSVQSISLEGRQSAVTTARFYTPSCHSVKVKGGSSPNCPSTPAPRVRVEEETIQGFVGSSIILRCNAKIQAEGGVTWRKKGRRQLLDSNHRLIDGALHILRLFPEDSGVYVCSAQNRSGHLAKSSITVLVEKSVLPPKPEDLQHSFLIADGNITAHLTWALPTSVPEHIYQSITGFQVSWGQRSDSPEGQRSDFPEGQRSDSPEGQWASSAMMGATVSMSFPSEQGQTFELNLEDLKEGTVYLVQVQALSTKGPGPAEKILFTTPILNFNSQTQVPELPVAETGQNIPKADSKSVGEEDHKISFREQSLKSTSGVHSRYSRQSFLVHLAVTVCVFYSTSLSSC